MSYFVFQEPEEEEEERPKDKAKKGKKKASNPAESPKTRSICYTNINRPSDMSLLENVVDGLGEFDLTDEFNDDVTHLIVGEAKRTVKVCRAIARGIWVLSLDWLISSMDVKTWIPEEEYELTSWFVGCQESRQRKKNLLTGTKVRSCGFEISDELVVIMTLIRHRFTLLETLLYQRKTLWLLSPTLVVKL